jgi:hypothetical protein
MRVFLWLLASNSLLFGGAIEGVVTNGTTGMPQSAVVVSLVQPTASGMKTLGSVRTDAGGKFAIDKEYPPGPALVQALYQGATYNLVLTPGTAPTGLQVLVYDSTSKAGTAKIAQDLLLIEPTADALQVRETIFIQNQSKLTFQDLIKGSVQFFVPKAVEGKVQATVSAPGGMPIQRPLEKTLQAGVFKVNYPLKPGETSFELGYSLPASATFSGKNAHPPDPVSMVTPPSVTLSGDGVESLGQEPKTQAHVYRFSGTAYELNIEGTGSLHTSDAPEEDNGQPKVEEGSARIYTRLPWVLGLAFGILLVGGVLLYRRGTA